MTDDRPDRARLPVDAAQEQREGDSLSGAPDPSGSEALSLGTGLGPPQRRRPASVLEGIDGYRALRILGEVGMGTVYEAEQQHPLRRVAVKVMRRGHPVDEVHACLFQREGETLARLEHPNIVAIYEAGHTDDGSDFFAMEIVLQGQTLVLWLRERGSCCGRGAPRSAGGLPHDTP